MRSRTINCDILIIGGGMSGCGAAWEARRWLPSSKIIIVDKANIDRSGAVAMGLSAINTYLGLKNGENTVEEYVKYVKNDLMGVVREDLVYDIGRHVDGTVHMFEEWGLPIWHDKNQPERYVREGRWQVMINGESYKSIVAEAARSAADEVYNRVAITHILRDGDGKGCGAVGFNVRDGTFYVFIAKAVVVAAGGASQIYRPRSTGEGMGRTWYPPWASGSAYGLLIDAGAVMTMMEARFTVPRYKDGYGPVGAWQLLLKARQTNAENKDCFGLHKDEIKRDFNGMGGYADAIPTPTNLRVYAVLSEMKLGHGPIYMHTEEVLTEKNEEVGWEDFLDMTISQALVWAAQNIDPTKMPSEILPSEPYVMGSHATENGAWASGPEDISKDHNPRGENDRGKLYFWGYNRMSTIDGVFLCGDACGATAHKFSSGSFTEGRIAGKSAARYIQDTGGSKGSVDKSTIEDLHDLIYSPINRYEKFRDTVTGGDVYSSLLFWKQGIVRLQKIMDEYAAGWGSFYETNEGLLNTGYRLILYLADDFEKYSAAKSYHELLRIWELYHRILTAESVMQHMMFRKESRWPGYYLRSDYPKLDDQNWKVYVNSRYNKHEKRWEVWKVPVLEIVG
ncbi:adenylyl-sulfate reductase subunit alpha [Thermoplasma sp.]|uniref:adenylyl-sulfate reductase subunit alpha n=1 Tax=Thermoplasma sp. TaxID=1973142 RepID=UPI0012768D81|nr:adenylyl-sulfate reductase subunit alpha [Thermoplasma sp.]KAA8921964.1 MAG: adenylyl-sulfate reductase subunit alpha [Thermoplasma sp.]